MMYIVHTFFRVYLGKLKVLHTCPSSIFFPHKTVSNFENIEIADHSSPKTPLLVPRTKERCYRLHP